MLNFFFFFKSDTKVKFRCIISKLLATSWDIENKQSEINLEQSIVIKYIGLSNLKQL